MEPLIKITEYVGIFQTKDTEPKAMNVLVWLVNTI